MQAAGLLAIDAKEIRRKILLLINLLIMMQVTSGIIVRNYINYKQSTTDAH
jgi:hypothetical protein